MPETKRGLEIEEAERRLKYYGENILKKANKPGIVKKFILSLSDAMTVVLAAAAIVSFIVSYIRHESTADAFIIIAIIFLNSVISVIQETKAENAIEALDRLSSPTATVIRSGSRLIIESRNVVPGDLIVLEKGCFIPADAKLLSEVSLASDESSLTGESEHIYKSVGDSVWAGTLVTAGHGTAEIFATGMNTRVGGIAGMLSSSASDKTPLKKRLSKMSAMLGNGALVLCAVIFLISVLRGFPPAEMFITSVSLAVAAIPEGLPATVTVMLSLGVTDMAKHRAVVKRLTAVETLGSATVICSDKTGTLTENRLVVTEFSGDEIKLSDVMAISSDNSSPTDTALSEFALRRSEKKPSEPISEIPFNSTDKYRITLHKAENGYIAVLKGAPEVISRFTVSPFDTADMEKKGLRVIAVATAEIPYIPKTLTSLSYIPAGCVGMEDRLRDNARNSVAICKKAGIKVVMITGDNPDTAKVIASKLGIHGKCHTESEISQMNEHDRASALCNTSVFARATPEFKVTVVNALKAHGEVVAMTGDGVNDAPALKRADIGCAMGKGGTDVAREAADIVLTDDDFSTIVTAVKAGRGIYADIRKAVHFLVSCNIGEILAVFTAIMLGFPTPLTAVQLLWVNLVTDSLPAIALGTEKPDDDIMEKKPVNPKSGIFSPRDILLITFEGAAIAALTLTAFIMGSAESEGVGSSMAFGVLSFSELFHSFNMRSSKPLICKKPNIVMLLAFAVSFAAQTAVMLIPTFAKLFAPTVLSPKNFLCVILMSASTLVFGEICKIMFGRKV